ncbi:MAG: hypothetical protein KKF20_00960 [Bacteroidetes bacterium]|nr:hypothetical protein [Bacteroidota bacterium]MBU1423373.1 hypothetical protein [Bacteroidota bacterium]MBU2470962.1 hypothetical protein [Bacteroidota bacterium]MBU2636942.1 hypothetical protein [Bacteroidota bacterium]
MSKKKIVIVTGNINSGKSTYLLTTYEQLESKEKAVGFVALPILKRNAKVGFELFILHENKKIKFASVEENFGNFQLGKYRFDQKLFDEVILNFPKIEPDSIVFLDEYGKLEAEGKGWYPLIEQVLRQDFEKCYLVVRKELMGMMLDKLKVNKYELIEIRP